ncbi:membrane protein insertase YidC [Treponema ruminis]|uniref:YidC/Oxa1 family membrane protein insertase n=1 Tax=Treponema ruminis TaxID=744515 RepID=A0A7W8LLE3_9SPIR|nr:membrane protein insertase YidC [Treponema ruminis]MBB5225275.1 YidC/Oxa1 family membrane protein insertase [Treponema ruminis]QSI01854.1 membrane protein insertase YidC [Treponema ruminis]
MPFTTILYDIILSPITQIIEITYRVFNKMFNNTGIAILGVSLAVTLLCLPLYIIAESWQETERSMQKRMSFWVSHIKKSFKGDEQYMMLNTYYRQNHYHPIMALRSSFGILIQIPFFLAAYHTLSALPDLQGRDFLFIKDMGKADSVFTIGSFSVNILPILMTMINCISGAIYSRGHAIKEKIQIYGMALVFLVVLYNSPAGLVLYWTMNNIFSLVKNIFYKMKNPLKILYLCAVSAILLLAFFILFLYDGGANLKKRLAAVFFLLFWIPLPYYVRLIIHLSEKTFSSIFTDKKLRFALFALSSLGLCILTGLVLPSQLITSSVQEFSNIENYTSPNAFLHSSFWMSFGFFVFWPACIYFLFQKRLQTLIAYFFSAAFLGAIVNSYIFNGNYGSMDVTLRFIDGFVNPSKIFMLLNILSLAAILVLVIFVIKIKLTRFMNFALLATLSVLIVLSFINTSKISSEYKAFAASHTQSTSQTAKFSLSKTQPNIVIFMLDRFESAFIEPILKDQKNLSQKLNGFTFYPNCLSFNGHTLMGSPGLYGGFDYTPMEMNKRNSIKLKDKHNEALILLPKLLCQQGFSATVSDLSWANYNYIADMNFIKNFPASENPGLENLKAISLFGHYTGDFKREKLKAGFDLASLSHVLNRNLFWVSIFRQVPAILRAVVYYKGTWWENGVQENAGDFVNWYSILYYLPEIMQVNSAKPTLSILTNECTHAFEDISMYSIEPEYPYSINDDGYKVNTVTLIQIAEFADYLRSQGIYDNTKIIVVSDHGIGRDIDKFESPSFNGYQKDHLNPVLLVKDFNSDTNGIVKIDDRFMTNADVPYLALKGIVENPVNPFTKNPIDENYKNGGIIATKGDIFMPYHSKSEYEFTLSDDDWIHIKDNIFIDSNWEKYTKQD